MAMMQTKGLYISLFGTKEQPIEPAPLDNVASNDEKKNHKVLKDVCEKEIADVKEKRNNVWCHLAQTPDATTLMLMGHDCVEDDGIGDEAKAWKYLEERFQSVETPTVVILVAQSARVHSRMLNNWIASSSEDRSCSQGFKKQGKQSQGSFSTPRSSMVCE